MAESFDFIVVGSGPAGCLIASNLAHSAQRPSVLLLEAGSDYKDVNLRIDGQRWLTYQKHPSMNWGYKTAPQEYCSNREIDYSRGKGKGGSSNINFGFYTVGAKDDYDEWARVVENDAFKWENMQRRFKLIETFHGKVPNGEEKYAAPHPSDHGHAGPIHVGYAQEWERDLTPLLDVFEQAGFPSNMDHNSGNPIGMSVVIASAHGGMRSTAADVLITPPINLTIYTDCTVQRLLIRGKTVVGVQCDQQKYLASKEVILSAGALDSPKILMHSGIGPKDQLAKYNIPIIQDSPVGQNLRDHYFTSLVYSRTDVSTDRKAFYGNQGAMDAALRQWEKDRSGDWTKFACDAGIGFLKSEEILASEEFKSLPMSEQRYLQLPTVPHYEVITHFPVHWFIPDYPAEHLSYSCLAAFIYNSQACGEATLQSSDPSVPLKFDPKFLSHPYDRRVAIESLRSLIKIADHPAYAKDTVAHIAVPKSSSDKDLLEYWENSLNSSWHMMGTAKMGNGKGSDAVVDSHFRVLGLSNLRVADMSVLPVLLNGHTQAAAYVTGATCAEMLISEYGLENTLSWFS